MLAALTRRISGQIAPRPARESRPARPTAKPGKAGRPAARTVFISDVHLGTRACRAEALLAFLQRTPCERLYLVGDIVDGWRLKRGWYWRESHSAVIGQILAMARAGTEVVYVPGNHDEALRPYAGLDMAGIKIRAEAIHLTADDRAFLVIHGDGTNGAAHHGAWIGYFGDRAYDAGMWLSERLGALRQAMGLQPWSLAAYLKTRVKSAVAYIQRYEDAIAREAQARGLDGAICGHIHAATIRRVGPTLYCNDGDWVESCTALIERQDGSLVVVDAHGHVLVQERPALAKAFA